MRTPEQERAARIARAQNARSRVAQQVNAAGDAPVVTIATDSLVQLLCDVDAALADAEAMHLDSVRGDMGYCPATFHSDTHSAPHAHDLRGSK